MKLLTRYSPSLLGPLLATAAWAQTPAPVTNDLFVASLNPGLVTRLNGLTGTTVYSAPVGGEGTHTEGLVKGPDGAVYVSGTICSLSVCDFAVTRLDLATGTSLGVFTSGGPLS